MDGDRAGRREGRTQHSGDGDSDADGWGHGSGDARVEAGLSLWDGRL